MAGKQTLQVVVLGNLIVTGIWLNLEFDKSVALERPIHFSVCVLLLSGLLWYAIGGQRNQEGSAPPGHDTKHHIEDFISQYIPWPIVWKVLCYPLRICHRYDKTFLFLVLCIVVRVILLQQIVHDVQCSWDRIEVFLPLLLSLYELFENTIHKPKGQKPGAVVNSPGTYSLRYSLVLGILAFASMRMVSLSAQHSTYICPLIDNSATTIRLFQVLSLFLDTIIIIGSSKISRDLQNQRRHWATLGQLAVSSASTIGVLTCLFLAKNSEHISWFLHLSRKTAFELVLASSLYTSFLTSIIYLMSELHLRTIFSVTSCISLYAYQSSTFDHSISYLAARPTGTILLLCPIAFASSAVLMRLEREASRSQRTFSLTHSSWRVLAAISIFMTMIFFGIQFMRYSHLNLGQHPINILTSNAKLAASKWLQQASSSKSLEEAVAEYRTRYGIPPPPNFDKWYEFATVRGSLIMDDFAQINEDLLPFWAMRPAQIREMTAHIIDRPWTEMGTLRVLNGASQIGPNMLSTHKWMLDGVSEMIGVFSHWLPDMDLAFNLNDECRMAIPWNEMETYKRDGILARRQLNEKKNFDHFSEKKDATKIWRDNFLEPASNKTHSKFFSVASLTNSFENFGTIACPPDSLSRTSTWWNKKAVCPSCASPHSLDKFVSNWTLSGSLCHQPDLQNLHGFHLSPAAFKPTRSLFPIFSQSKIPTFSDIVYPSPWNYIDKVTHDISRDMPFSQKFNTLFWRGATSESITIRGSWQGMQRQRFVHLVNYTPNFTTLNLLLQASTDENSFTRHPVPLSSITSATNISVAFVGGPNKCVPPDCMSQLHEFTFAPPVDFQEHWKYKYLFDLDGAGFSGRFLPFLQSHSLVFRAASFRQWFDERLTGWRHFVPVDTRLLDVWDLLAYFGGLGEGRVGRHDLEGEIIAEEGRDWAKKVLRKEDMEIYMFRLLLEWGRLVDDGRDNCGFVMGEK